MNWFSLIPAALGALGGLFGLGGSQPTTSTTSSTTQIDPALKAAGQEALTKAHSIWQQPYQQYTGERVAGPTASRAALDPLMSTIGQQVNAGLSDANGYQTRISSLLGRGPGHITAPTLVPGGATASYTVGN